MKRKALRAAFPHTLPVLTGYAFLGLAYGILMQSAGFPFWYPALISLVVYAGSMQYVAVDLLAGGASLIAAALMTLTVNARHLFYGISMVERYRNAGPAKPYMIFALTDETYSLVCSGEVPDGVDRNRYFFLVSLFNQAYWVTGSAAGALVGGLLPFDSTGIDFSMTALFLVVMTEQWRASRDHTPALVGLGVSLVCLLVFGADGFLIPAMVGITLVLTLLRGTLQKREKEEDAHAGH